MRKSFAIGMLMLALAAISVPARAQFGTKFNSPVEVQADQNGTWNVGQAGTWTVTATQATGTNFHMVCDAGCGGASSFADGATFIAGTTPINVIGAWYSASATNCTSGQACAPQLTIDRKLFVQAFQGTSPWAVSGTFWQTTQPVSGTLATTQSGTWNVGQSGTWTVQPGNTANTTPWLVSLSGTNSIVPVTGTFFQATQPVSGTFFQATQPISGTVAATQSGTWNVGQSGTWTVQPGNTANTTPWLVSLSGTNSAVPVTGTFFQATQPVSIASMPSTPVTGTFFQTVQPVQDSSSLTMEPGVIPVIVLQGAPPLPATTNALLYRAALKTYCYQNLAGCGPAISGGTLK